MSDDDTIDPADEGRLLAAEYVLGVLSAQERRAVESRLPQEAALAADVAFWEERLGGLADTVAPVTPSPETWSRIEAKLAASTASTSTGLWQSLAFWRAFAIGSAAFAAACVAALVYLGTLPSVRGPLMATLNQTTGGQPGFVATVGADGASLTIIPAALLTNDPRAMELWLIPKGDKPHSLGLIQPGQPIRLTIPPALADRTKDATLAVSLEPPGGSPTGAPTGPVIAAGPLLAL